MAEEGGWFGGKVRVSKTARVSEERPGETVKTARVSEERPGETVRVVEERPDAPGRQARKTVLEKTLQDAWRRSAGSGVYLRASDGRRYRVIYAGRSGGSFGPDFLDAALLRDDGRRVHGDVEIHVRRGDWRGHGHDRDPRYNGVTFHAFLEGGGGAGTTTRDRRSVRELHIGALLSRPSRGGRGRAGSSSECAGPEREAEAERGRDGALVPLPLDLSTAGEERFAARVSGARLSMQRWGVDQALYSLVMECLGYPRNKRQFRQLAERMPWEVLAGCGGGAAGLEALLLWSGGFGAKPAGAPCLSGSRPSWTRGAGRPDNAPERRLRGAARLAARWMARGGPARALAEEVMGAESARGLVRGLEVPGVGGGRALIGGARAAEIAVNAALPGVCAASRLYGRGELESRAAGLYRVFPALPENAVTREARALFSGVPSGRGPGFGAREQQGLIYLYRALTLPMDMTRQLPLGAGRGRR